MAYGSWTPRTYTPPKPAPLPQAVAPAAPGANAMQLQAAWNAFNPALPQTAPLAKPFFTPDEQNYFDTAQGRAKQQYGHAIGQDQYTQATELQNHNLAMQSLGRRYDEVRRRLPGSFVRRGVGQSGIAQQGYSDYASDRNQAVFAETLRHNRGIGQHKITQDQTAAVWDQTAKDLVAQKTARLNTISALVRQQG